MLTKLLRRAAALRSQKIKRRPRPGTFRPQFEGLEERCCLSAVEVSLSPAAPVLTEANQDVFEFTVKRTGGLADPFFGGGHTATVKYKVGNPLDTATPGRDYRAQTGVLRFGKFDTTKTIRISVVDDKRDEDDETFSILLTQITVSRGGTGSLGNRLVFGTIVDNDDPPTFTVDGPAAIKEANRTLRYKVKLSEESGKVVELDYGVIGRDPTLRITVPNSDPGDLVVLDRPRIGVLTFQPGQIAKTISVKVIEDKIVEPQEAFAVGVFARQNAVGAVEVETTIIDDDKAIVGIRGLDHPTRHTEFEGQDGDTVITLKLRLFSDIETDVFPAFETSNGTATVEDGDYVPDFRGILFRAGSLGAQTEVSVLFNIKIKGDTKPEKSEKFYVNLLHDDENFKIVGGKITVTIFDDDSV